MALPFLCETTPASFYPNVPQKATFPCNKSKLPLLVFPPPLFCELFFVGRYSSIGKPCLLRILFCSVRRKRNSAHIAECKKYRLLHSSTAILALFIFMLGHLSIKRNSIFILPCANQRLFSCHGFLNYYLFRWVEEPAANLQRVHTSGRLWSGFPLRKSGDSND